jgi:hypothetical protein
MNPVNRYFLIVLGIVAAYAGVMTYLAVTS